MTSVYIEVSEYVASLRNEIIQQLLDTQQRFDKLAKNGAMRIETWLKDYQDGRIYPKEACKSAVLVPLILNKDNKLEVLLSVRHGNVSIVQDEVCLPGGKYESKDTSIVATALRECTEEIGLLSDNVDIIDIFNGMPFPVTRKNIKYLVYPVVGIVKESFYAKLNVHEVFDVFTYPLIDLLNKQESCEDGPYISREEW